MKNMTKIIISIVAVSFFAVPSYVYATPMSWDFANDILKPLLSAANSLVQADRFESRSVSQPSTFPYASTTALTASGTGYFGTASTTNLTVSALTSGRVPYITTAGAFTDSSALTFDSSLSRLTATYASSTASSVSGDAYFAGSGIWNSSGNVGIGTTPPINATNYHGL